jgi:phage-related protein
VREFLRSLPLGDQAEILAEMAAVSREGMAAARHLRNEIYEVRANAGVVQYRVLFAQEGHRSQVLLSLEAFTKKTQKTPPGADRPRRAPAGGLAPSRRQSISTLISH